MQLSDSVYLGRLNAGHSFALSLRESIDPQSRFALVGRRRVETNCVTNPHSSLHEFEKQSERDGSARVSFPAAPQLFGSAQDEIDFRVRIRVLLLKGGAIRPHFFG